MSNKTKEADKESDKQLRTLAFQATMNRCRHIKDSSYGQ